MCVSYIYYRVTVYCVFVLVIVDFLFVCFKLILGCLFSPHHVNQGGVQKTTPQVTLYKELLMMMLPPHERVCVVGHLLHSDVCI